MQFLLMSFRKVVNELTKLSIDGCSRLKLINFWSEKYNNALSGSLKAFQLNKFTIPQYIEKK
jgi:hypothetical protein